MTLKMKLISINIYINSKLIFIMESMKNNHSYKILWEVQRYLFKENMQNYFRDALVGTINKLIEIINSSIQNFLLEKYKIFVFKILRLESFLLL